MDDIISQSHNQNSIYVLNSNCRPYEEFSHLNLINNNNATNKNVTNCQHSLTSRSDNHNCYAASQTLQHTLRNLGNFCDVTETIENPVTTSPSLLSPAAAITPPATRCLPPAAAAFQKLFNCSYVANVSSVKSIITVHADGCCEGDVNVNTPPSACKIKSNNNNKKKSSYVKPSLIAKKMKFRKFIENEKLGAGADITENHYKQHCANNNVRIECSASIIPDKLCANSCKKESNATELTALTSTVAAMTTCGPLNNIVKHYWNGKIDSNAAGSGKKLHHQQSKSNNWSGNCDSNIQQQKHLEMFKSSQQQQKSNCELYKEAAKMLGLSCTLCDNCRCLECQSRYFDCDDSDSYSEFSNPDEYDEDAMHAFDNSVEVVMYTNCYSDDAMATQLQHTTICQSQKQKQQKTNFMYADSNSNATEFPGDGRGNNKLNDSDGNEVIACTRETDAIKRNKMQPKQSQKNNDLDNFTILNGLRLTDADAEAPFNAVNDA